MGGGANSTPSRGFKMKKTKLNFIRAKQIQAIFGACTYLFEGCTDAYIRELIKEFPDMDCEGFIQFWFDVEQVHADGSNNRLLINEVNKAQLDCIDRLKKAGFKYFGVDFMNYLKRSIRGFEENIDPNRNWKYYRLLFPNN